MSPSVISFIVLILLGIHLVSASPSYDSEVPTKYNEEKKAPSPNNNNYNPKDYDDNHKKDNEDDHDLVAPKNDNLDVVFSLTVPTLYSDYDEKKKKPSNYDDEDYPLDPYYYYKTCPEFESIVSKKIRGLVDEDETLIPSVLRLHFHDCVVRGCDASILLNHEGSERKAVASKTLRGFEVIDEIKSEVEKKCPRIVSCADILTAAARDATVVSGGKYWRVEYGRKDGLVSKAEEADSLVPMGRESITDLIEKFQSLGLDIDDLVALSGAHTIGRSSCGSIQYWLYNNYTTSNSYDSSINEKFLDYLQRKCRWASDYIELDTKTPKYFDNEYYINLVYRKTGVLSTDRLLYSDSRTSNVVKTLAYARPTFYNQFKKSMKKLGNVQVLTGPYEGQIRANCNFVNSHY